MDTTQPCEPLRNFHDFLKIFSKFSESPVTSFTLDHGDLFPSESVFPLVSPY